LQGDIADRAMVAKLLAKHKLGALLSFEAKSHVDPSIHVPGDMKKTNGESRD